MTGKEFTALLRKNKINEQGLANAIGVTINDISRWKTGGVAFKRHADDIERGMVKYLANPSKYDQQVRMSGYVFKKRMEALGRGAGPEFCMRWVELYGKEDNPSRQGLEYWKHKGVPPFRVDQVNKVFERINEVRAENEKQKAATAGTEAVPAQD